MNSSDIAFEIPFNDSWLPQRNGERYEPIANQPSDEARMAQVKLWLSQQPPAVEGSGGDAHTYSICCTLVKAFRLSDPECLSVLSDWNQKCSPSWDRDELLTKINNARNYGQESSFLPNQAQNWEPIIPLDEYNLPDFPRDVFPEPLEKYLEAVSESSETPRSLAMMLVFSAISAAVKGSYQIKINDSYYEPCPVWIVVILEQGIVNLLWRKYSSLLFITLNDS